MPGKDGLLGTGTAYLTEPEIRIHMKIASFNRPKRRVQAWTLAEVMVSVVVLAILMISLFAGFGLGFQLIKSTREDLRATQILTQKIESIRLCTYSQLTNLCPMTFQETYSTTGTNGASVIYRGTITAGPNTNLPPAYVNRVRLVTVSVTWTTSKAGLFRNAVVHNRSMQTQSAFFGLQNYLYGVTNSI
jgi:type II secretory pathway pseudopilin PulG